MVRDRDGAARALRLADGQILVECSRAFDRGLIDLLVLVNVVRRTVASNSTQLRHASAWVVIAVGFDDVVLDEWAFEPAVDG